MNEATRTTYTPREEYLAHEAALARQERTIRRFFILTILLVLLLVGTNAAWIWYEAQFEDSVTTVEQEVDTKDGTAYVAGIGDITYGESEAEGND